MPLFFALLFFLQITPLITPSARKQSCDYICVILMTESVYLLSGKCLRCDALWGSYITCSSKRVKKKGSDNFHLFWIHLALVKLFFY